MEFDRYRQALRNMSGLLARGRLDQLWELVGTLVEHIGARERQLVSIVWIPPTRPFLTSSGGPCGPAARAHDTASQKPMRSPGMSRNAARQPTADGRQDLARLAIPEQLVDELDRRSLVGL